MKLDEHFPPKPAPTLEQVAPGVKLIDYNLPSAEMRDAFLRLKAEAKARQEKAVTARKALREREDRIARWIDKTVADMTPRLTTSEFLLVGVAIEALLNEDREDWADRYEHLLADSENGA